MIVIDWMTGRFGALTPRGRKQLWLEIVGIVVVLLLTIVIIYSVAFKTWCSQYDHAWGGAWGEKSFGADLGSCVKNKSLFEF